MLIPCVVALTLTSCLSTSSSSPGIAPRPFTAGEIRKGCPYPRVDIRMVETAGEDPYWKSLRFENGDANGTTISIQEVTPQGKPKGRKISLSSRWEELRDHATFPADATEISEETISVKAGTFSCLRYTVVRDERVERLWFATDRPGPPIRHEIEVSGKIIQTETLVGGNFLPGSSTKNR